MPKVKNPNTGKIENFPYTPKGEAMAEDYAESTGQEVIPTYDAGGRVQQYELGSKVPPAQEPQFDPSAERAKVIQEMLDNRAKNLAKQNPIKRLKKRAKDAVKVAGKSHKMIVDTARRFGKLGKFAVDTEVKKIKKPIKTAMKKIIGLKK